MTAPVHTAPVLRLRTGNQLIAEGAVEAGCRFFAGYPITPASGIYKSMIELLQDRGDVALSAPDEISALAYCVGASIRGYRAMTATSGPGWALMIETFQYALMTETPLVVAMVQRLGPSTGGATQGAQGDILLAEFCTSGGYTVPVLCPSTPAECFELTMRAFDWSERLRTPVILLTDKEVGMTMERVDYSRLHRLHVAGRGEILPPPHGSDGEWKTYDFEARYDVPPFEPVGGRQKVTVTGSAHNKTGELKKNDAETLEVLYHLEEKIRHRAREFALVTQDGEPDADTLVISFGITARAMRQAVRQARARGRRVASLTILSLFPIPFDEIRRAAASVRTVVVAEENLNGQYRQLIESALRGANVVGVNKIGAMITPAEIEAAIG
jgi:2-oxoglutarate ferredoxin oxidoreductase subunit alpha